MTSSSAEYYRTHPAARERKKRYDTRFESSPAQKAKRRAVMLLLLIFNSAAEVHKSLGIAKQFLDFNMKLTLAW